MEPAPTPCDLLIDGALVLTLDAEDRVITDGAVAVAGDRITAVGDSARLAAHFTAGRRIDARDRIVMPGLVNTHNHTPLMIVRGMAEDLGPAPMYTPRIPQGTCSPPRRRICWPGSAPTSCSRAKSGRSRPASRPTCSSSTRRRRTSGRSLTASAWSSTAGSAPTSTPR